MAHYDRAVPANQLTSADPSVWVSATAAPRGRPGHTPIPRIADAFAALAGLGFGITLALVVTGETRGSLAAPGGLLIAAGRLAGITGAYLMLVMVVLIARIPWLERSVGQDRLLHWHRRIGPWSLWLITSHVALVTFGYAQLAKVGALRQLWDFLTTYPDILAAGAAFGLLVMVGFTSIKIARRHLEYETWWIVHLYTYLALALAFAHQIVTGGSFIGHPLTRAYWIAVWVATGPPADRSESSAPAPGRRRPRGGTRGLLGHLLGSTPWSARGIRRPVLPVALPDERALVARTPVFALRTPATPLHPGDRQGTRRSEPRGCPTQARNARIHRGALWRIHPIRTHVRKRGADRCGGRYHSTSRAARGPARVCTGYGRRPGIDTRRHHPS